MENTVENSEKISKLWRKYQLNSEKIWKIQKKKKLKCEMIWKIWKKSKLNSEKIWKIWKISVCHNYTQRDLPLLRHHRPHRPPPPHPPPPPPSSSPFIHVYTLFFRNEKNHPGIVFFARDYASRDQIYHFIHLTLKLFSTSTVRTWLTTWST
jgi:hypothetical protein